LQELKRFDAALEILRALDAQFPDDPDLQTDRRSVMAAREQYERETAPQRALQERAEGRLQVQQLVVKGLFDAALEQLDRLLLQFPGDAELERDRQMVESARDGQSGGRPVETPVPQPPASNPPQAPAEPGPEPASPEESSQSFLARLRRRLGG
jgi:predicted component of type VI protein secretion system